MINSQKIKKISKDAGADIVGIASMDRWEGAPKQMDPRYIHPNAKSMIVLGFRHFRGLFRGIEEGTFFSLYSSMGYAGINGTYQPLVLWKIGKVIEDNGYEAVCIPNRCLWGNTDASGIEPEKTGKENYAHSRPVENVKPAPNIFVQVRIAAFLAGLGEIGWSKMFLSPEFGPRQRLALIITDAQLDPDPLYNGPPLCDRCMMCANACTNNAIPRDKTIKITLAGREIEWADIDMLKCSYGFCGSSEFHNPFMVTEEDKKKFNSEKRIEARDYKINPIDGYSRALEGASGCIRACMIHLEQKRKIKNLFNNKFRRKKPWKLDKIAASD